MTIIDRRHSVSEGTAIKAPCRAATTVNLVLTGEQTVDGVALVEGDRVLVKNQTDGAHNGIYEVSTGNWTRTRDFDGAFDVVKGTVVRVTNGATNVGFWELSTANSIVIDSTSIGFGLATNSISGVSAFVQTLLGSLTGSAFIQAVIDNMSLRNLLDLLTAEPVGVIHAYAGTAAPTGYLLCYGQAISRTTYAALFSTVGAIYGAGDGSTTFNVPDLRGRVPAGQDDMGGTSANRLTGQSGGLDGDTLGAVGGAETHTLTTAQIEAHVHTLNDPGHTHKPLNRDQFITNVGGGAYQSGSQGSTALTTSLDFTGITMNNAGGGGAHNNVQPTIILNYIIKT